MTRPFAALAATLALAFATPAAADPPAPAAQGLPHISVLQIGSAGSPVILIPGLSSPREVWDGVAPDLAKTHRVYLVQINGFGGDAPGANLAPGVLAGVVDDLHGYIAVHHLGGAAVVGHSLGGLTAMLLAKAHPGDAGRLMIVDALPFYGVLMAPPGSAVTPAMLEPAAGQMRKGLIASYGQPANPALIERQTAGMALAAAPQARIRGWAAAADARVVGQALFEDLTTDLRADLPALKLPLTLVYPWHQGDYTREATAAFYRAQYAGAPQMSVVEVADAAHFVMLDQPAAFATALARFLRP